MANYPLPKLYHPDLATPGRKPVGSVELEKNRIAASLCHLYMHALGGHDLCGRGGPLLPQSGALASKNDFKTQYNTDGYWLAENLNAPANEVTIVCRHNIINQNNSDNCWVFTNASDSTAIWEYLYNNDLRHRANGSADDLYVGAGDWISGKIVTHVYTFSATTAKCQIWENGRKLPLSIQENANNTNLIQKLRIGSDTSSYNPEHEVELIAILDRVLSDAECRLLSADVYSALIRPSIPMMYFTSAGGGGTALTVQGLSQAQTIDAPTLTQDHNLTVANIEQPQTLGEPILTQVHSLIVAGTLQTQTIAEPTLTQDHILTVAGALQSQTLALPTLTQAHLLTVAGSTQKQTINNVTIAVTGTLGVNDVTQTQTINAPELIQAHLLVVATLLQTQTVSNVDLVYGLVVNSALQTQTIDLPALSQAYILVVQDLGQTQTIGQVSFGIGTLSFLYGELLIGSEINGTININVLIDGDISLN